MDVPTALFQFVQTGGAIAVLVAVVYALLTGRLYTGQTYKELEGRLERAEQKLELLEALTPRNADNLQRIADYMLEALQALRAGTRP